MEKHTYWKDILENIKLGEEIPIWQKNTNYLKKKLKISKGLNFLHNLFEATLYYLLFLREKKTKNPPKHIPSQPYKKILTTNSIDRLYIFGAKNNHL
jgi:hypothetical protein